MDRSCSADDPQTYRESPSALRVPAGAVQDIRDFWAAGRSLYNLADLHAPVLLIHGEWDADVPVDLAQNYFRALEGSTDRRWMEIAEATHLVLLERNRMRATMSFFDEE